MNHLDMLKLSIKIIANEWGIPEAAVFSYLEAKAEESYASILQVSSAKRESC